jgi:hypothetical protein
VTITTDFWATTAQIIPALVLAIVVWDQSFGERDDSPRTYDIAGEWVRLFYILSIGLGVLGEFVALNGLLGGGSRWAARLVVIAIGLLSQVLVGLLTIRIYNRNRNTEATDESCLTLLYSLVVALMSLAATLSSLIAAIWLAIRI